MVDFDFIEKDGVFELIEKDMEYIDQLPLYWSWADDNNTKVAYDWEGIADELADQVQQVTGLKVSIVIREDD